MVAHYSKDSKPDKRCPNCGKKETSAHLCVCSNTGCTRLLQENVEELEKWLYENHKTEPQLAQLIPSYILGRGKIRFSKIGFMSPKISELAKSQDIIGWKNFMEGRISKSFVKIQEEFLKNSESRLNGQDWVKQFITRILRITHSQWIYRNISFHENQEGSHRTRELKKMREEAIRFAQTNPLELNSESRFLLELDVNKFITGESDYVDKCYYIAAARAAMKAGKRKIHSIKTKVSGIKKRIRTNLTKPFRKRTNKISPTHESPKNQGSTQENDRSKRFITSTKSNKRRKFEVSSSFFMFRMRSNKNEPHEKK